MHTEFPTPRIAAVHAAPVFLDKDATLEKVARLSSEAASQGADLVAFGEAFLAGYPIWNGVIPPIETHDYHESLVRSSIEVPGRDCDALAAIARDNKISLSIGVNELAAQSLGQVFNSNLIFDSTGTLINHRRKLVATFYERLTWSHGDGHALEPVEMNGLKVGALICGENTNPLAKYSLVAQGERIHVATYPPSWPFDSRPGAVDYDLAESIHIRSASHCFEGKVFALVPATALGDDALDLVAGDDADLRHRLSAIQSSSMIIGPRGESLAGPTSVHDEILYADVDLSEAITLKRAQDVSGTYNRFDVFSLSLDKHRHTPISITGQDPDQRPAASSDGAFGGDENGDHHVI